MEELIKTDPPPVLSHIDPQDRLILENAALKCSLARKELENLELTFNHLVITVHQKYGLNPTDEIVLGSGEIRRTSL